MLLRVSGFSYMVWEKLSLGLVTFYAPNFEEDGYDQLSA